MRGRPVELAVGVGVAVAAVGAGLPWAPAVVLGGLVFYVTAGVAQDGASTKSETDAEVMRLVLGAAAGVVTFVGAVQMLLPATRLAMGLARWMTPLGLSPLPELGAMLVPSVVLVGGALLACWVGQFVAERGSPANAGWRR